MAFARYGLHSCGGSLEAIERQIFLHPGSPHRWMFLCPVDVPVLQAKGVVHCEGRGQGCLRPHGTWSKADDALRCHESANDRFLKRERTAGFGGRDLFVGSFFCLQFCCCGMPMTLVPAGSQVACCDPSCRDPKQVWAPLGDLGSRANDGLWVFFRGGIT